VDWIDFAQDMDKWRVFLNTSFNLGGITWLPELLKKDLLHGVI
jgi:hypothetical protein